MRAAGLVVLCLWSAIEAANAQEPAELADSIAAIRQALTSCSKTAFTKMSVPVRVYLTFNNNGKLVGKKAREIPEGQPDATGSASVLLSTLKDCEIPQLGPTNGKRYTLPVLFRPAKSNLTPDP